MKLLFDQNLSPRLVDRLSDLFPDSSHVSYVSLQESSDLAVWEYARDEGYVIVTKDADFIDLSVLYGTPPQTVWLRIGNCTTDDVERLIRNHVAAILDLGHNSEAAILTLL